MAREEPVEKRGPGAAYVKITGWRRREASTDFRIHFKTNLATNCGGGL
jgi:hypothetical protein